jgi:hypothetical protein
MFFVWFVLFVLVLIGNHWPFLLSEKPTGTFRENHDGEITMANLTENFVQGLKVPDGLKDIQVFDDKLPGFGVRKYEQGHACYIVKFSVRGEQRKRTLGRVVPGNLKAMRLEASNIPAKAHQGIDAVAEVKAAAEATARQKTLGELVGPYLEVREKGDEFWSKMRPKSLVDVTRYLQVMAAAT